jgi:large subunit ribosomal protein L17
MVTSLFKHERITTTKAKAQAIRRTAEKMITRAKVDSVHNRRMIARDLKDKSTLAKLFVEIAPRYKERPGGYTRVLKIGHRLGDAAEMVLLELVEEEMTRKQKKSADGEGSTKVKKDQQAKKPARKAGKKSADKKSEEPAPEEPVAEEASAGAPAADDELAADDEPAAADDAPADSDAGSADTKQEAATETVDKDGQEHESESEEGSDSSKDG